MLEKEDQSKHNSGEAILLVTPVWKDSSRLAVFGRKLATHLAGCDYNLEWMIADDGSGPNERQQLSELHDELKETYAHMSLHFADEHRGKGSVVREAWAQRPDADWYVFVDADGSLSPAELSRVLDAGLECDKTILPIRKRTEHTHVDLTIPRRVVHKLFILAVRMIVEVRCTDPQCGAKMLKGDDYRMVAASLREIGLAFDTEMLTALSENDIVWKEMPVTWIERDGGKVKPMRDAWGMLAALWKIRKRQRSGEFKT
jgi:glycosyltransferase involved in cell wall biosynthesis